MEHLNIGDTVQNSTQNSIVRWIGEIEGMPIIGLESLNLKLPGYTDGTCPFNNIRYFTCSHECGYYVLGNGFNKSYRLIQRERNIGKDNHSDEEYDSVEESLSSSPKNERHFPAPIQSISSPSTKTNQQCLDNNHGNSPSRGVLRRFTAERDRDKTSSSSPSKSKENSFNQTSSRRYQPENYRSQTYEHHSEPELTDDESDDDKKRTTTNLLPQTTTNDKKFLPMNNIPTFGQEYFLDNWTLGRLKRLIENQISADGQLCLNISDNESNIRSLIHEQINECLTVLPASPPFDVRIELIRLFGNVQVIFPSRSMSLYGNDYLLLAVLCSNNNCAYIRTSNGWAFTDEEGDHGQSLIVNDISRMIDDSNTNTQYQSEQCRHLIRDAAFLYYKLVL